MYIDRDPFYLQRERAVRRKEKVLKSKFNDVLNKQTNQEGRCLEENRDDNQSFCKLCQNRELCKHMTDISKLKCIPKEKDIDIKSENCKVGRTFDRQV